MQYKNLKELSRDLKKLGYKNLKEVSARRLAIISDKNRKKVLMEVADALRVADSHYDPKPLSTSSAGIVWIGKDKKFSVLVKPASMQGSNSAGIKNELFAINTINHMIVENAGSPIDVMFTGGGRQFTCKNIVNCKDVGRDTKNRKKADFILVSENGREYPVSLKKDNAQYWESAEKYWGKKASKYIDKAVENGQAFLVEHNGYYTLEPNIAIKASSMESRDVVFGSDVANGGAVITRTFTNSDFKMNNKLNRLSIEVSSIIRNTTEVPDKAEVYFLIRNDRTRNNPSMPKGLRVLAAYKSRINRNVKVIR